jgi:hypothetical protein
MSKNGESDKIINHWYSMSYSLYQGGLAI